MTPLEPVLTLHLFPPERAALLNLLSSLAEADWRTSTVCAGWSVKDIAAHLLADDLGRLSRSRDAHSAFAPKGDRPFEAELLDYINAANEAWVEATRRLSPRILIDLLRWSGEQTQAYFESLDLFATGEPVSWAGPEPAPVWLDIAREYTERWLHQQQIRDAVGQPGLTDRESFAPVLDTFVRALPYTFRNTEAADGTHVKLVITGDAGGEWSLVHRDGVWTLGAGIESMAAGTVTMDGDTAWRLFTKGISKNDALAKSTITGAEDLAETVFDTVSIIA